MIENNKIGFLIIVATMGIGIAMNCAAQAGDDSTTSEFCDVNNAFIGAKVDAAGFPSVISQPWADFGDLTLTIPKVAKGQFSYQATLVLKGNNIKNCVFRTNSEDKIQIDTIQYSLDGSSINIALLVPYSEKNSDSLNLLAIPGVNKEGITRYLHVIVNQR